MLIFLLLHDVAETSSPYSGVVGLGAAVDGASPGLPLALPAESGSQPASHTGSPDPAALTVLQPSNGASQHYSTMLPSFGYSTTGTSNESFSATDTDLDVRDIQMETQCIHQKFNSEYHRAKYLIY